MSAKRAIFLPSPADGPDAPPYSPAIVAAPFVFVSGQLPIDPDTRRVVGDDIETQTEQALRNVEALLTAAGSSLDAIVKTTVFLSRLEDWAGMNTVYRRFAGDVLPARSAIECGRLAQGALVEIEAIALVEA
jgi:2-iminobutanoate/2-iminopropanoate deaminase